ncbi:MAG TPA: hypothetical protein VE954_02830 [Oligoflexus sp.]|uniref:hypothetical protein n=1 Tax=Oligoflexus sp. TaxID=1971216 RepID=UPI002D633F83|nr:hypothetical protein [Oligoflexus sp.]HYX32021.1 hypothetical protein [Oligoflexus sp.]
MRTSSSGELDFNINIDLEPASWILGQISPHMSLWQYGVVCRISNNVLFIKMHKIVNFGQFNEQSFKETYRTRSFCNRN